jgi:membrane associated rhomboid family serine protease
MVDAAPLVLLVFILLIAAAVIAPLIPIRRRRRAGLAGFPVVTVALIAVNIAVFAANATTVFDAQGGPHIGLANDVALHWGMTPRSANLLTLVSHMFLHGSWGHVLGNMLGLYLFGPHVEEALGRLEYLLFYIGSGIAAGLLHLIIIGTMMPSEAAAPLVGASGAIFGVLGLFAVRFWRARVRVLLFLKIPAIWAMSAFALLQVVQGVVAVANGGSSDNTANWAHVGGFLFGLAIAIPLKMREDSRREYAIEDAESALATGQIDKAASHYRAILAVTPDDAAAHHALGRICVPLRQGEAAFRHLQEAIRLYLRAGESLAVAHVYADAVSGFSTFPLTPSVLQRVASACEETQQYALAQHALAELCRDHPDAREAELGLLRLGKLHLQKLGQPDNAVGIFSEFIRLYPESEWIGHAQRLRQEATGAYAFSSPAAGGRNS